MEHNNIHVNGKKNTLTDIMKMKCLLLRFYSIYCYLKKERKKKKKLHSQLLFTIELHYGIYFIREYYSRQ